MSRDVTYCTASGDGRCVNNQCRRFVTNSMAAAMARDGTERFSFADMFPQCAIKKEPTP